MRSKLFALVPLLLAACHSSDSDSAPDPGPAVFNADLAAERVIGTGDLRLVLASEAAQGLDLDGDGDTADTVVHILDLEALAMVNTHLAVPRLPLEVAACTDALGAFLVSEDETGVDLDQDGALGELETGIFDRARGLLHLPFAYTTLALGGDLAAFHDPSGNGLLRVYDARDGSLTTHPEISSLLSVNDGIVAFTRDEAGVSDLNADGDSTDRSVLHLFVADSGRVVNTSFAILPFAVRIQDGFVGFNVLESDNGGLDLNRDGDAGDQVFVAVDARTGLTRIPGFSDAFYAEIGVDPAGALLAVSEDGQDRNGDGDALDRVLVRYDPRTDREIDTGLAVGLAGPAVDVGACVQSGSSIGVLVRERAQGGVDLDGDGRVESSVPHVFDASTGRSVNLGFRGIWLSGLEEQLLGVRFLTGGPAQFELFSWDARSRSARFTGMDVRNVLGTSGKDALVSIVEVISDLNGDGDTEDFVLGIYQGRSGSVRSLPFATSIFEGWLSPGGRAAVLVSEAAQGKDLNGDGDLLDQVLPLILLDPPLALGGERFALSAMRSFSEPIGGRLAR